ncbi:DUF2622 domain-containing protein [Rosenbergiella australiborealis]|uniref:DUF2622 domain-containing protein n=1 Tax=Rosenbergiella australiborealis TaxID=1544696 RepID=UPI001F4EAF2E|nr:DUF2622 domain-containing protein [Rosenbergiella australiborealis]
MADFTVRVELHDATSQDYENLHQVMTSSGFQRSIISTEGIRYNLPEAEYDFSSESLGLESVLDKAIALVNSITNNRSIFITQSKGRMWVGLKKSA